MLTLYTLLLPGAVVVAYGRRVLCCEWWVRGTAGKGKGSQHLLTRQGGHVTPPSEPNKMQNSVGDPSCCTT